ncbi:MAG: recombinase family protein [Sphingorhabdus sp.]|uniref:recombinase family protein n=1 Tax=Sphingorhabdus sp. TaxID=1902408 RepID=UPI00273E1EDB|nr:recombinase family protein [Sphingorhabdus sp.]MDP4873342.1 recombinase family protein [Sphingorhabdus sp.]
MISPNRKRCAIYTRKSTEEGLEMDFNSLDAQREACAAYILSQAGEGWEQVGELYDDGGWSGGSMIRPALKQLLDDIQAGKVDIVVVYKVDRLTRSLADFAKIVEILDARGASFVSVTQAFNTTNSMGRLTLNVLLSFAQFEREVTGERIRDKIAASKRKGMWMGGTVPHGYRVEDRKLLIEPQEAEDVRYIFTRYLELKSVPALVDDLARRGMRTRTRTLKLGRTIGNVCFGKGPLGFLLKNPVFIGKIKHKDAVYDGEHDPIIDHDTFDRVQATLAGNSRDKLISKHAKSPSLLAGLVTDPDGRPMSPSRGKRGSKQYCYYVTRFKVGEDRSTICRLPAGPLDQIVIKTLKAYLSKPAEPDASTCKVEWQANCQAEAALADSLDHITTSELRAILIDRLVKVNVAVDQIDVVIGDEGAVTIATPAQMVRRGNELRIALSPDGESGNDKNADAALVRLLVQGFAAREHLLTGEDIPAVSRYEKRHLHRLARMSWLAPDIITAILDGRQPVQLTARHLMRCADIPMEWQQQRQFLGFI